MAFIEVKPHLTPYFDLFFEKVMKDNDSNKEKKGEKYMLDTDQINFANEEAKKNIKQIWEGYETFPITIDNKTIERSKDILESLGLDINSAISVFLHKVVLTNGIPFDLSI